MSEHDIPVEEGGTGAPAARQAVWRETLRLCAPLAPAVLLFGFATGLLANAKGFSALEAVLMSALVFAGASQVAALEAWTSPPALLSLAAIVAAVNSRYFLVGATLGPVLRGTGAFRTLFGVWLATDPNWALTMQMRGSNLKRANFLIASGVALFVMWTSATALGHAFGSRITDLHAIGVDLLVMTYFALLMVPMWNGQRVRALAWAAALVTALGIWAVFGGHLHVVVGALVAATIEAIWGHDEAGGTAREGADHA